MREFHLSKSRYLAGRQCGKRLWLGAHQPELASEPEGTRAAIIEMGIDVGLAAHALFPGGVLVEETHRQHAAAVTQTQTLIADESVPAIFEAAFEHEGVRIRVDVLERLAAGQFGLREVKASTRIKEVHALDLAVQLWVLRGVGLEVPSAELIQINKTYKRASPEMNWNQFFKRSDLMEKIEETLRRVPDDIASMHQLLEQRDAPAIETGPHCHKPFSCDFWDHCTSDRSPEWFINRKQVKPEIKSKWIEAAASGEAWVSSRLSSELQPIEPPVWYLDFEALAPAIPIYTGTRPFEALAFQWSLHHLDADGQVRHFEFLAKGDTDPRFETSEALLDVLGQDEARIVVYSNYEARMLNEMARHNPGRAAELTELRVRVFDLLRIVRAHVYHPGFGGSFSIKYVAPALAPEVRYDDLGDIAQGTAAAAAFARIGAGTVDLVEEARLREALLSYCERDTFALLEVHRALRRMAADA